MSEAVIVAGVRTAVGKGGKGGKGGYQQTGKSKQTNDKGSAHRVPPWPIGKARRESNTGTPAGQWRSSLAGPFLE